MSPSMSHYTDLRLFVFLQAQLAFIATNVAAVAFMTQLGTPPAGIS